MKKLLLALLFVFLPLSFLSAGTITNPSRDENTSLTQGATETITWSGFAETRVSLSLYVLGSDGKYSYLKTIVSGTANDGAYDWKVDKSPSTVTNSFELKICSLSATGATSGCTWSDPFSISGTVTTPTYKSVAPTLTLSKYQATAGEAVTASWSCSSQNGCYCTPSTTLGGLGSLVIPGSKTLYPEQTTIYSITCNDKAGQPDSSKVVAEKKVIIGDPTTATKPSMKLLANGQDVESLEIEPGARVNLSWIGSNLDYCWRSANPNDPNWLDVGGVYQSPVGIATVFPKSTTEYRINCARGSTSVAGGSDNLTVSVKAGPVSTSTSTSTNPTSTSTNNTRAKVVVTTPTGQIYNRGDNVPIKWVATPASNSPTVVTVSYGRSNLSELKFSGNPGNSSFKIPADAKSGTYNIKVCVARVCGQGSFVIKDPGTSSKDSDGDGVPDSQDKCANTYKGTKVDLTNGCPLKTLGGYVCNKSTGKCQYNRKSGDRLLACARTCVKEEPRCKETSFRSIASSLNNISYTKITEDSFAGWASQDPYDPSGDIQEIREEMGKYQRCYVLGQGNTKLSGVAALEYLLSKTMPATFTYYLMTPLDGIDINSNNLKVVGAHATVATNISRTSNGYSLTVVDPNSDADGKPQKRNITCTKKTINILSSTGSKTGDVVCTYFGNLKDPNGSVSAYTALAYPMVVQMESGSSGSQDIGEVDKLIAARQAYCASEAGRNNPNFCNRNVAQWLEANYPLVANQGTRMSEAGMCAGWSTFVMRVGYLGDFVGECKDPNPSANQATNSYMASLKILLDQLLSKLSFF